MVNENNKLLREKIYCSSNWTDLCMPNGDRYVLSLQDLKYTKKSYFVCHEILIVSGNLIN